MDTLVELARMPPEGVLAALAGLEIKERVQSFSGGSYRARDPLK
ncbi:MAG: hypothetical protein ACE5JI_13935 [Acidobacteriota bacterium]